jgi:catechol 2,3-dioxygenase-like lactoylglutathione lyase family enzyme
MFDGLRISQIFVLDQQEALDFYVGTLGLEVNTDQDFGFMRFLTVNVPGDPDRQILLEKPGPPAMDPATTEQIRDLLTKQSYGIDFGLRDPFGNHIRVAQLNEG